MADPAEVAFDPSSKKKKKKAPLVLDDTAAAEDAKENSAPVESADSAMEDFGKKKKKKSKKIELDDEAQESVEGESAATPTADDDGADIDFSKLKKTKKKKAKPVVADSTDDPDASVADDNVANADGVKDYTYDELLQRVYNIMKEKNPGLITGENKKFVIKPPQVSRVGTKKSAFANFADICRIMKRSPKHVLTFLLAELGTSGSIDGNNCLIIKGRFQPKHIEIVLRKYIKEYVTCHTCRSPETILEKDNRLNYLQCETCGSRCSVTSIKSGYQAVTANRKRDRMRLAASAQAQTTKY